jgi:hypothetical protein
MGEKHVIIVQGSAFYEKWIIDNWLAVILGIKRSILIRNPYLASFSRMDIHDSPGTEAKYSHEEVHLDDDLAIKRLQTAQTAHHDVVFGEITEDGPNYCNVHNRARKPQSKLTSI